MNTPFTHPIAQSSSRNWFTGAKTLFAATVACFGLAGAANAQTSLFNVTAGGTAITTAPSVSTHATWYGTAPALPLTLQFGGAGAVVSSATSGFGGLTIANCNVAGSSGGNKIIFPGNQVSEDNGTPTNYFYIKFNNLQQVITTTTQLKFNFIKTAQQANPAFKLRFKVGANQFDVNTDVQAPNNALQTWSAMSFNLSSVANTGGTLLNAISNAPIGTDIRVEFVRVGNTGGANGDHFYGIDDIALTGTTIVDPCAGVTLPTGFSKIWVGAGAVTTAGLSMVINTNTSTNTDLNNLSNWCPSTAFNTADKLYVRAIGGGTITVSANRTIQGLTVENTGTNPLTFNVGDNASLTIGNDGLSVPSASTGEIIFQNSTSSLANLTIAGNLTNLAIATTAKLNLTDAKVTFNKATAGTQTVSSSSLLTFGALTVDSDAGEIDVTLNNDVKVTGALSLTKGILFTGANKLIYPASATISENSASYLRGNLEVEPRQISSVMQDFGGLGLRLTLPANSSSYATTITRITGTPVEAEVATAPGSTTTVTNYSISRVFEIHVTNPPANIDATMEFDFWNHELGMLQASDLRFFRQTANGSWSNKGLSTYAAPTTSTAGTLTLNNVEAFSTWTLGSTINPLPVELISFSAKRDGEASSLEWRTAKEENNAGYEIEASTDNRNFVQIGYVHAMQTAYQGAEYSFVEPNAARFGVRYYRLTQYDLDGTKTVLGVRSVNFGSTGTAVITGPNPFTYGFAALVEAEVAQPATLILTDALGREVARQQTQLVRGVNQLDFDGANLSTGSYILSVQLATDVLTIKVNKQ